MELVRLTVVGDEIEADQIQSLLKFEDIESMQRPTDVGAGSIGGSGAIVARGRSSSSKRISRRLGQSSARTSVELFVLRLERGGPWDWSRDMRERDGWDEHAKFMDDLVDEGFITARRAAGGRPRDDAHRRSAVREAIRERFATDPVVGERHAFQAGSYRALGDSVGRPWLS